MNKTTEKYANAEHYEQVHAYLLTKDETKGDVTNPHVYRELLAANGLTVNLYDCKQWIASLGSKVAAKGFKLSE